MFGRLVSLGEGTEDTRRRVLRSELLDDTATQSVIDDFVAARLLTLDRQTVSREPTVEVAHEALIREWPRLRAWIEDDRDDLRTHRHLTISAEGWIEQDRDAAELYRGGRLEGAEQLAIDATLNDLEEAFLRASASAREEATDRERRRVRRLQRLVAGVAIVAALALVAGTLAVIQRNRANDVAQEADVERMAAIARRSDAVDPTVAVLLAVEAHRADPSAASLDALHRAMTGRPAYLGQLASDQVWGMTALDDGIRVVVNTESSVDIWNAESRTKETSWPVDVGAGVGGVLNAIATDRGMMMIKAPYFSDAASNGSVAAVMADTTVKIIDLETGDSVGSIALPSSGTALAISPSGEFLVIGTIEGDIQFFETRDTSAPRWSTSQASYVADLAWAPGGDGLVSGYGNGEITMFAATDGDQRWTFAGYDEWESPAFDAQGLLFSGDGDRLVAIRFDPALAAQLDEERTAGFGQIIQEFDATTGQPSAEPIPVIGEAVSLQWADRAEQSVVNSDVRSTLSVYDLTGQAQPRFITTTEARGEGGGMAAMLELDTVVTAGRTGMAMHSIRGSDAVSVFVPLSERQAAATPGSFHVTAFDDTTNRVATTLFDFRPPWQQPEVFDLDRPGDLPTVMPEFANAEFGNLAISFGPTVLTASFNGLDVRRGLDGTPVGPTRPLVGEGGGLAVASPTGDREAALGGGPGGLLLLRDPATGDVVADLTDQIREDVIWMRFSTDGAVFDVYSGRFGYSFDAATGALIWEREEAGPFITGPDGEYYAVAEGQVNLQLLVQETKQPIGGPFIGHGAEIFNFEFNQDASLISSRSADSTLRIWSTESQQQLGKPIPSDQGNGEMTWSPDGTRIAYPEAGGMRVWNYDTATWPALACELAGRNLTVAEWEAFGPRTVDYRPTCEQFDPAAS